MKVLFIGGTGRLSKDVVKECLNKDMDVYLLTRGSKHRKEFVDERCKMIYVDIRDKKSSINQLAELKFDVVIDFLSYTEEQLRNTLEIVKGKYKQYVFISTAAVYKLTDVDNIIKEDNTEVDNHEWSYAKNKIDCEQYLEKYFESMSEEYTIIRPAVTYGNTRIPYLIMPQSSLREWSLINRILKNKPVPVMEKGNFRTSLLHTKDFAVGVVGVFLVDKAYGEAFHITSEENVTWEMVLQFIGEELGKEVVTYKTSLERLGNLCPEYKDMVKTGKGRSRHFSNSKIIKIVPEYKKFISLREGVKEAVVFYTSHPHWQNVDYYWEGKMDRLCECPFDLLTEYKNVHDAKSFILYMIGRITVLDIFYSKIKKTVKLIK